MNKNNKKMNTKKTLVSFLLIASVLFSAVLVSAAQVTTDYTVEANEVLVSDGNALTAEDTLSVVAGDSIDLIVKFTSAVNASDLKMRAELQGNKDDVSATSSSFDVEAGNTYTKTLRLEVPSDFDEDELSTTVTLAMKIWNSDDRTEFSDITFSVQKASYDVAVKSVITNSLMDAGATASVNVMVENIGYNDAEDLYVTVKIPELNIAETAYFGDLVSQEDPTDDDAEMTASGKFYLNIPFTAKAGKYTLIVEVENSDGVANVAKKDVVVTNSIPELAMKSGNDLVLINPTNQLKVYKLIYQSNEVSVILPAASTKTVPIEVPTSGDYSFDISVFSGNDLLSTVKFSGSNQAVQVTSPVFVLTVILAIVFLVLLVALIVLITKKPQKAEEFGESYY